MSYLVALAKEYGTVSPNYVVAYVNDPVIINCNSNGRKTWWKDGKRLTTNVHGTNLRFVHVFENLMGEYICQGTLAHQIPFTATATLLVGGMSCHNYKAW